MFSHVMVGADDLAASTKFYDATLGALGVAPGAADGKGRVWYRTPAGTFGITKPIDGASATGANGGTIGFAANSSAQVHAWHDVGVASGGTTNEDPPGIRESGRTKLHLAYLRDPAGNKLCALFRETAG